MKTGHFTFCKTGRSKDLRGLYFARLCSKLFPCSEVEEKNTGRVDKYISCLRIIIWQCSQAFNKQNDMFLCNSYLLW